MTRLSCHRFRANDVRLWLSVIAYNLGNLWRRLALPKKIARCRASGVCASLNRDLKMEIPARCEVEIGEAKRKFRVNSERAWVVGGMIMRALRWRRLAPLGIVLATIIGIIPGVASAACPAGNRTLTFTNKCGYGVYLGQNLSSPQLQSTSPCTVDSDCNPSANLECVGGLCNETCLTDADCGPNQVCYNTTRENASGKKVKLCYFKNFEPTSLSSPPPSSGSAWQLPANGGKSELCIPEGPTAGTGGASGAPCAKNSDCISHTCAAGHDLNRLCKASHSNSHCTAGFTFSCA